MIIMVTQDDKSYPATLNEETNEVTFENGSSVDAEILIASEWILIEARPYGLGLDVTVS